VIVASPDHPLAQIEHIDKNTLNNQMWILREYGSGTREATETLFKKLDVEPKRRMYYSSTQPIKESVGAGMGISLLSKWAVQKEIKYGDLTVIDLEGLPFKRVFSFVRQSPFQTKALEVFIDLLRENKLLTTL